MEGCFPNQKKAGMKIFIFPRSNSLFCSCSLPSFFQSWGGFVHLHFRPTPKRTAKNMKKEWSQPTSFSAMSPSIKLEESETIHFKPKLHFKIGASNSQVFGRKKVLSPWKRKHRGFSRKKMLRDYIPQWKNRRGLCFYLMRPVRS